MFFFLGLAVAMTGQLRLSRAQGEIDVVPGTREILSVKPGSIVSFSVVVTNRTGSTQTFDPQVQVPTKWRLVTPESQFTLEAGANDARILTLAVPGEVPGGLYRLRYLAKDRATPAHEAAAEITVKVETIYLLKIEPIDAPRFVIGGRSFTATFDLTNAGNTPVTVTLEARSSEGYATKVPDPVIALNPRDTREIPVSVVTDKGAGKVHQTLQLIATSRQDSTVAVSASVVTDVVSQESQGEEQFVEYPIQLKLRGVGEQDARSTQFEVSGYGSLSEKRDDKFSFLARGPETQSISSLGLRDEYYLSYVNSATELQLGDMNYTLSPLTESGRFATGAGARTTVAGFSVGGLYDKTRWIDQRQDEGGGFVSYQFSPDYELGANYLNRRDQYSSDLYTLRGLSHPFTNSSVDVEYGRGAMEGKSDDAVALRFNGTEPSLAYDIRYIDAGTNFGGYYRDLSFKSSSISYQISKTIRLETYFRDEERNLARDTNQIYAPRDQFYQLGLSYFDLVSFYYHYDGQDDLLENPKYRRSENTFQMRVGFNFAGVSINGNSEYGVIEDKLALKNYPYQHVSLFSSVRPTAAQNYSASVEYSNDQDIYTGEVEERLSASLSAWVLFGEATQVQFNIFGSRVNSATPQTSTLSEFSLEHIFPFNHKITLRARQNLLTPAVTPRETAYLLEYAIPLNVPIARIGSVGSLRGRVVGETGVGLPNILVNAGESASVTDGNGEFYLPGVKPGPIYVQVDKESIGLDRVTLQPMPLEVEVRGGEETPVQINVTRSAQVSGTVVLYEVNEEAPSDSLGATVYREKEARAGVFMALYQGDEVHRRVTDSRGRYVFGDLRPGSWTLRIEGGDIPDYHRMEPDSLALELKAGTHAEGDFKILPRKRIIKIIQQGVVEPEKPENAPQPVPQEQVKEPKVQPKAQMDEPGPCLIFFDRPSKKFMVQISSWKTRAKAQSQGSHMGKILGRKVFVDRVNIPNLGIRYRVITGKFNTRAAAEAICKSVGHEQ